MLHRSPVFNENSVLPFDRPIFAAEADEGDSEPLVMLSELLLVVTQPRVFSICVARAEGFRNGSPSLPAPGGETFGRAVFKNRGQNTIRMSVR